MSHPQQLKRKKLADSLQRRPDKGLFNLILFVSPQMVDKAIKGT
jgi:hypothetical protein